MTLSDVVDACAFYTCMCSTLAKILEGKLAERDQCAQPLLASRHRLPLINVFMRPLSCCHEHYASPVLHAAALHFHFSRCTVCR